MQLSLLQKGPVNQTETDRVHLKSANSHVTADLWVVCFHDASKDKHSFTHTQERTCVLIASMTSTALPPTREVRTAEGGQ